MIDNIDIYSPGSIEAWVQQTESKKAIVLIDFFDTILIRSVPRRDVFKSINSKFHFVRELVEFCLYRIWGASVTIQQIVKFTPFWRVDSEIEEEIRSLVPNRPLIEEIRKLANLGHEICIVSDTYYSASELQHFLAQHTDWVPKAIFTSSSKGVSKSQGLYAEVMSCLDSESTPTLVVGDDIYADGLNSTKIGLDFKLVLSEISDTELRMNVPPSELGHRALIGIVKTFSSWISEQASESNFDKLLFLSRDTHVFFNRYITLDGTTEAIYTPASRLVALEAGVLPEATRDNTYIGRRSNLVSHSFSSNSDNFISYYGRLIGPSTSLAVIDLGWNGTFQTALQAAFPDKKFQGLYLGILPHNTKDETKQGLFFDHTGLKSQEAKKIIRNLDIIETLFCDDQGTLLSVGDIESRANVTQMEKLISMVTKEIQQALMLESPKAKDIQGDLELISLRSPDWFIRIMANVSHKVSPLDKVGQPLFIAKPSDYTKVDRIWWREGQKRYNKYLLENNIVLYLVNRFFILLVDFRLIFRALYQTSNHRRLIHRLLRTLSPKRS